MADPAEVSVITLGGKGSSLASSSVYAIAHGFALVRIDSSALERLASSSNSRNAASIKHEVFIPDFLTREEARASLVVLLNKLIISSSSSSGIRSTIPVLIAETLNSKPETLQFESLDVTDEELSVFKQSCYVLIGICALLDHQSAALSSIADAVAGISCEASRADVSAFSLMDSGDGFASKEEVGVANDMKVLLNGSKLVGKIKSGAISKIPKNHGSLREQVKLVHSKLRVELNSSVKIGKGGSLSSGIEETVRTALLSFAAMLWDLGKCSLDTGKLILGSNGDENIKASLAGLLDRECPSNDSLKKEYRLVSELALDEKYVEFVHTVNVLLVTVWKIVAWEAIAAFLTIEGGELIGKGQDVDINGAKEKVVKKSEKKKKAVLGKGTSVVVQLLKDRLQGEGGGLGSLENSVKDLLSFLDPKASEFDNLLKKIKEIVESNESRRLPKLPKSHPVKGLRYKPFPHFDELAFVFGKDGATGAGAKTIEDMVSNATDQVGDNVNPGGSQDYYIPDLPVFGVDRVLSHDEMQVETPTSRPNVVGTSSRGSKRKRTPYHSEVVDIVRTVMDMTSTQIQKIAEWPKAKHAMEVAQRKEVVDQLYLIPDLEDWDKVLLMNILFPDIHKTNNFLSVPMDLKKSYCMLLLGRSE